jgi:hypothetical protein
MQPATSQSTADSLNVKEIVLTESTAQGAGTGKLPDSQTHYYHHRDLWDFRREGRVNPLTQEQRKALSCEVVMKTFMFLRNVVRL